MSVASHLAIRLDEYDERIRTFIPHYDDMIAAAAAIVGIRPVRTVVDLGTGTGALAARVLSSRRVRLVGVDEDAAMLEAARRRLGARGTAFVHGSFLEVPLPRCDAFVASLSLHHVRTTAEKRRFYRRARRALSPGGFIVSADCYPSAVPAIAENGRERWIEHLATTYGRRQALTFLRTWAREDFYVPLQEELSLLTSAGFRCDVTWRRDSFAVIVGEA